MATKQPKRGGTRRPAREPMPPFPKQHQSHPGSEARMQPRPEY